MAVLKELTELGHFLFESDFPFAPAPVTGMEADAIDKLSMLSEVERPGMIRNNALVLFPRVARATLPEAQRLERLKQAAEAKIEIASDKVRKDEAGAE